MERPEPPTGHLDEGGLHKSRTTAITQFSTEGGGVSMSQGQGAGMLKNLEGWHRSLGTEWARYGGPLLRTEMPPRSLDQQVSKMCQFICRGRQYVRLCAFMVTVRCCLSLNRQEAGGKRQE